MYKKILVPLDGSEFSESILEHVTAIATGCSVPEVILLTAIEPFPPQYFQDYPVDDKWLQKVEKEALTAATSYLASVAQKLKTEGVNTQSVIVEDRPAEAIMDYAAKNNVDLIIMSTHGRSGVSRWVFGSVADKVIRNSTVPVLAAPPTALARKK